MFNTIDLFAGCGGLTEGFHMEGGFQLVAAVEWEKRPAEAFKRRLQFYRIDDPESKTICFDIQRTEELLKGFADDPLYGRHDGLLRTLGNNTVDVVIGGPPCQAYSIAGRIRDSNGMHDDYRNYLFESYIRILEAVHPKAFIFENVPGILSAAPGGLSILNRIITAFNQAGYAVSQDLRSDGLVDASHYCVPQSRKRIIIAGFRREAYANPEHKVRDFYLALKSAKGRRTYTVKEAIGDLPRIVPNSKNGSIVDYEVVGGKQIEDHIPRKHSTRDAEIFRMLAEDIERAENRYTNIEALRRLYTETTGKNASVHKYYVLRRDRPSNTIPAHLFKDGLRHIHYDSQQSRSITVREAARLQSFPDNFEFAGSMGDRYKMIGNAVPPELAKAIAFALKKTLESEA